VRHLVLSIQGIGVNRVDKETALLKLMLHGELRDLSRMAIKKA